MTVYVKNLNKNFNQERLQEELVAAGLEEGSLYWGGFDNVSRRIYTPSTKHGFPAGELKFTYDPELTAAREETLDAVLAAHDSNQLSKFQRHKETDELHRQQFVQTANAWDTLTNAQKIARVEHLFRAVARLIDSTTDL